MCVCVYYVCACVRACVRACMRACVHACALVEVFSFRTCAWPLCCLIIVSDFSTIIYIILDVLRPVKREWSYQGEIKCIPTTSEISDSLLSTHSTVEEWRNLEKMMLNEPGRQKLGRNGISVSGHSTQGYIPTYYRNI